MRKTSQLKKLLKSEKLSFFLEAHNALSAKIVEEAGFPGIWASGLCLSASMGVRDNNELSWTQVLDILEFMSDATHIPILLDGDTGYGNFNNMQRLVRKLEQIGVAGVCIEDKLFPKTNSFIASPSQELADIEEFCGKIKAGKAAQQDKDFCIVARTEAFIVGAGLSEALKRAEAYQKAGADAILVHSKRTDPQEIIAFAGEWKHHHDCPLIIVPTTYYNTPVSLYRKLDVHMVIWGNHLLRASLAAMRDAAQEIKRQESPVNIEDRIASVQKIFQMQNVSGLLDAEKAFLPAARETNALILAASRGEELGELTKDKPKAMLDIAGKPILERLVESLRQQGIRDISVVTGYRPRTVAVANVTLVHNPGFETSRDLLSFGKVKDRLGESTIISYGDVLVRNYVIRELLQTGDEITIVVDSACAERMRQDPRGDYVVCSVADSQGILLKPAKFVRMFARGKDAPEKCSGQWIGMMIVKGKGKLWVEKAFRNLEKQACYRNLSLTDLLNRLVVIDHRPVSVLYIRGHWLDVNHLQDIEKAVEFTGGV